VVVDVSLLGVVALLVYLTVVVAMSQRSVVVGMGVPRGSVLIIVTEATHVMVADVPMVMAVLGCRVGMLGLLALALGPLPDVGHRNASFRIDGG
jgi:hypothetical protein